MSELLLYTAQQPVVLEALEREGVSRVLRAYIDRKYGDTAWIFQEAYSFFRQNAAALLPPPAGAESPVWLYADSRWCHMGPDSLLMRFRIPEELVLCFDRRIWNRILNLEYVGEDAGDEARFERELRALGLESTLKLFSTAFYPVQKRKVRESWKRLFSSGDCPEVCRQAAVWELRREWLTDVRGGA